MRRSILGATILVAVLGLVAVSTAAGRAGHSARADADPGTDTRGTIKVGIIPSFLPKSELGGFHSKFPSYSIKVIPQESSTNAPQVINQAPNNFDVAWLDTISAPEMQATGGLSKLNLAKIPNAKKVDVSKYIAPAARHLIPSSSCIPTDVGKIGIVYDSSVIKQPIRTWADYFKVASQYKGKVLFTSTARDAFVTALTALHLNVNSENPDDYNKAASLLKKFKPNVLAFNNVDINKSLLSGSAVMAYDYDGFVGPVLNAGKKWKWVNPSDGTYTFVLMFCALKGGSDVLNGIQDFLNYHNTPSVALSYTETTGFRSPLSAVNQLLRGTTKYRYMADSAQMQPAAHPVTPGPLSPKTERLINQLWNRVISG
jgi:spermidine/putrescine transport system substrate-binding protein